MISRYLNAARDQDIEKPWEIEADDDNLAYDREPVAHRAGRKIVYAMMIAMGVIATIVAAGQLLA